MKLEQSIGLLITIVVQSVFLSGCWMISGRAVQYHIPSGFEGAIVIRCDQPNSQVRPKNSETYIVDVPDSGITGVSSTCDQINGMPRFVLKGDNRAEITYLARRSDRTVLGQRSFESLTEDERGSSFFAMNYESGTFNTEDDLVHFISFLICKPKDGNFYASTDLPNKIAELRRATE